MFRNEIGKEKQTSRFTGEYLRQKVQQSGENVRLIQSGKGLIETIRGGGNEGFNDADISEGLPVFTNKTYTSDLYKLLATKDLERSFDL